MLHGLRPVVYGVCPYGLSPSGPWPTACGLWPIGPMAYGLWFMVYGLWSMFIFYGLWSMVFGLAWSMVYGLRSAGWPAVSSHRRAAAATCRRRNYRHAMAWSGRGVALPRYVHAMLWSPHPDDRLLSRPARAGSSGRAESHRLLVRALLVYY